MPPTDELDRELLALVNQAGREGWTDATFRPIYERYYSRFLSYLRRQVGRPEVAMELTQEVMMNIYKAPGRFDSLQGFEAWMTTVSQNVLKNHWRALSTHKRQGTEVAVDNLESEVRRREEPSAASPVSPPIRDPLEEVLQAERQMRVVKALARLPVKMRSVVVARYRQGRSYEECATILGVSVSTVKSQLHEARKRLAKLLGDPPKDDGRDGT